MMVMRPSRTASSAGPTILAVSTNHWSVSIGSITTLERSPKGCMIFWPRRGHKFVRAFVTGLRRGAAQPGIVGAGHDGETFVGDLGRDLPARLEPVEAAQVIRHEVQRVGLGLGERAPAFGDLLRDGGGLGVGQTVVAHVPLPSIRR
jgi:hypothetical protein